MLPLEDPSLFLRSVREAIRLRHFSIWTEEGSLLHRPRAHLAVVRVLPDAELAVFPTRRGLPTIAFQPPFPSTRTIPRINGTGH